MAITIPPSQPELPDQSVDEPCRDDAIGPAPAEPENSTGRKPIMVLGLPSWPPAPPD